MIFDFILRLLVYQNIYSHRTYIIIHSVYVLTYEYLHKHTPIQIKKKLIEKRKKEIHTTSAALSAFFDRVLNSDTAGVCCVAGTCTPPREAHSCIMHSTSSRALYANARECVLRSKCKIT